MTTVRALPPPVNSPALAAYLRELPEDLRPRASGDDCLEDLAFHQRRLAARLLDQPAACKAALEELQAGLQLPPQALRAFQRRQALALQLQQAEQDFLPETFYLKLGGTIFSFNNLTLEKAGEASLLSALARHQESLQSRDAQGHYVHKTPFISVANMHRIRQYLNDSLPRQLEAAEIAELQQVNEAWGIEGFDAALQKCQQPKSVPPPLESDVQWLTRQLKHPKLAEKNPGATNLLMRLNLAALRGEKDFWINGYNHTNYGCFDSLPESLGVHLRSVEYLELTSLPYLTHLPASLTQLSCLTSLELNDCRNFIELPATLGQLTCLRQLKIGNCPYFMHLPASLTQLVQLQSLSIVNYQHSQGDPSPLFFPENMQACRSLTKLVLKAPSQQEAGPLVGVDWQDFTHLRHLEIPHYFMLDKRQILPKLTQLTYLHLYSGEFLRDDLRNYDLPEACNWAHNLRGLELPGYPHSSLPMGFAQLTQLTFLNLFKSALQTFLTPCYALQALTKLDLRGSRSLNHLPADLPQLIALRQLDITNTAIRQRDAALTRANLTIVGDPGPPQVPVPANPRGLR